MSSHVPREYKPPSWCKMPPVMLDPDLRRRSGLIFGYARGFYGGKDENTPSIQEGIVERLASKLKGTWGGLFCDVGCYGVKFSRRPAAACLLQFLLPGDKLVIPKFSAIGLTLYKIAHFCHWAAENKIDVHVADFSGQRLDLTGEVGFHFSMHLYAFDKLRRSLLRDRAKEIRESIRVVNKRAPQRARYGWLLMSRAVAKEVHPEFVRPGSSTTVYIPCYSEREHIRQMWRWRREGESYQAIADRVMALRWRRADRTPWTKKSCYKTGRAVTKNVRHAIEFYDAMLVKHGRENWEDGVIQAANEVKEMLRQPSSSPDASSQDVQATPAVLESLREHRL